MSQEPTQHQQPPMAGTIEGEILQSNIISIHGDVYYDLLLRTDPARNLGMQLRAPSHACTREPRRGTHVRIHFLMGQVTNVDEA